MCWNQMLWWTTWERVTNKPSFVLKWSPPSDLFFFCSAVIWIDSYRCLTPAAIFFLPSSKWPEITQRTCVFLCHSHAPYPGFSLWWLTAEDTCGGTLRGSSGLISSFDFPGGDSPGNGGGGGAGGLGSSGECKWTILADPGDTISLVFTEFQMEEKSDFLEIEGSEPPTIWWVDLCVEVTFAAAFFVPDQNLCVMLLYKNRGVCLTLTWCWEKSKWYLHGMICAYVGLQFKDMDFILENTLSLLKKNKKNLQVKRVKLTTHTP